MSRKHYREVAEILKQSRRTSNAHGDCAYRINMVLDEVAHEMGSMFKRDNSRFDSARFYAACGLPEYTD